MMGVMVDLKGSKRVPICSVQTAMWSVRERYIRSGREQYRKMTTGKKLV